jgi:hypothetical protein
MQTMLLGLVLVLSLQAVVVAARPRYSVRNMLAANADTSTQTQRRDFAVTFSDEGIPYGLPQFSIRLIPTPGILDNDSLSFIETEISDYLKVELKTHFSDGEADLTDVIVIVANHEATGNRQRQRNLETGTQLDLLVTLMFEGQPHPKDNDIEEAMDEGLSNMDTILNKLQGTPQLENVASLIVPTAAPTEGPTRSASPSAAPVTTGNDGTDLSFSQANKGITTNIEPDGSAFWPALIVGVAVFVLTVIFLAHRRTKVADVDESYDQDDVSVDCEENKDEIEVSATRTDSNKNQRDGNVDKMRILNTVEMDDGSTTIHIPPVTNSSSRVYDTSQMVLSTASSVGSSFDEQGQGSSILGVLPSTSMDLNDSYLYASPSLS